MEITVATYNILHGYHKDLILSNIQKMINQGVSLFCFQEAEIDESLNAFFATQPGEWKTHHIHLDKAANLAFAWKGSLLSLQKTESIILPTVPPVFIQRLKGHSVRLQRAALVGLFTHNNKTIRITNAHLAWEGGLAHRLSQIKIIKEYLSENSNKVSAVDIFAGDFNTFALAYFRNSQRNKVQEILGSEFKNVLPDNVWTCDVSYTAPQDKWETIAFLCKLFRVKLQSHLDYMFVRNGEITKAQILDLPGSDHRPIVATLHLG